jgi:anaerobic selenocysteine-containing dehydrogenase
MKRVRGACPHDCPDTCGIVTEVGADGRAIKFYGDPDHAVTQGWLCAKVRPYLDHVYHPDRLTYPLVRTKQGWKEVGWPEAIGMIKARWEAIIEQYGAEAILPYSYSGTLGLVQMGVASGRFWNRLGASQLERSICGAAAEKAVEVTLGARHGPPYEHVLDSRLVILWGHNPVSTAPHFMPFLRQAQRNGAQLVVIDPRRTRTAKGADWHLTPLPGTDGALALAVAHEIVANGWHDEGWLAEHTFGWPQLRHRLQSYTPEFISPFCGIAVEDIKGLAKLYAATQPGLIKIADGINRNFNGGQAVRAICALPAITGQYGRLGGGLAYSTSGYIQWDSEAVNKWSECPPPGRMVNMNRLGEALLGEVDEPPIKSLFVFGANPVTSAPNAGRIIEGLQREDLFTVVHDLFMTDTAAHADLVLPATSQLEQSDLHKAYGHTLLTYNEAAITYPEGEPKSNWEVMGLLAEAMGFTEPWLYQSVDEVIAEVLAATAENTPVLEGITLERLKAETTVPLHIESIVPFLEPDGRVRFPTADGKVALYSKVLAGERIDPLPHYKNKVDDGGRNGHKAWEPSSQSLGLISGAAHHFVSSSLANQQGLRDREGTPFVEIHPADAAERGIQDGDTVVVENGRGWCQLRAVVTDGIRRGVVASPKGRWQAFNDGRNINFVTSDALGDMEGQSTFHSTRVWVRRINLPEAI